MKALFKSVAQKIAYLFAALVVLAALSIVIFFIALHWLSPIAEAHRGDLETLATQFLGAPVTVEKVSLSWQRYHPSLDLDNVTVLSKETQKPALQVKKVNILISVTKSLWERQWVPSGIMVTGTEINILEKTKGEYVVQGFPAFKQQPFQDELKIEDVLKFLADQPDLILHDIDVHYTGITGQPRFVTLYRFGLYNNSDEHSLSGKAILHQDLPMEAVVAGHWEGKSVSLADIKASLFIKISSFSISQWLKDFKWQGWQATQGFGSLKVWATWDQGTFQRIQTNFKLYDLNLYAETDKSNHVIRRLAGEAGWERDGNQQIIGINDLLVDLPHHLWPVTNAEITLATDHTGELALKNATIGYLDLKDVQPFLMPFPWMSPEIKKTLAALNIQGNLQNIDIALKGPITDWHQITFSADANRLSVAPWKTFPGVSGVTGRVNWSGTAGNITLNTTQMIFNYASIFSKPLTFDQVTGAVAIAVDPENKWTLQTNELHLLNSDLSANVMGSIKGSVTEAPYADLKMNFSLQKANRVTHYLPMNIFDAGLQAWLQHAFLMGEVSAGRATLRGPLKDFPFEHGNGEFTIVGNVNNATLRFAPDWPLIQKINANLVFSGRKMVIDVNHGQLFDLLFGKAHAEIPYLGPDRPAILGIKVAPITANFAQAARIIHASPLNKKLGKMFSNMDVTGPLNVTLDLTVPLSDVDKTTVNGWVNIPNANVNIIPAKLNLTNAQGILHFTEKGADAKTLKATLFNEPMTLKVTTIDKTSALQIDFLTKLAVINLEKWLKLPFTKYAKGAANIQGQVDVSFDAPLVVKVNSDLVGISTNLPEGYAKKAETTKKLNAEITVQDKQPLRIKTLYGDELGAALLLEQKKDQYNLIGINLRLGAGTPDWPAKQGLYISGTIPALDEEKIKSYMTDKSSTATSPAYTLQGIDVQIGRLTLWGQTLSQAKVSLTPQNNRWNITISDNDVVGQIQMPKQLTPQGQITATFQKLHLRAAAKGGKSSSPSFDVSSLPAISLTINNFSYNDMYLGQLQLKTYPSGRGQRIQQLRINTPAINIQGSGSWTASNTRIQGAANANHLSNFLDQLNVGAHNFIAEKADASFDFGWGGPLYAPALSSLNGNLSLTVGAGHILNVGDSSGAKMGMGRLLNIFSLQSLPRRLTLDFSDLFQKGYSFDSIKGDFKLQNGNAFTSNFRIEGPVARVGIDGRIGLANQDLNFTMSVSPYVTSSLPVAATLLTGPVGGLVALGVNTVVGSQISKAITYLYEVKGSWSDPSFEPLKTRKSTASN